MQKKSGDRKFLSRIYFLFISKANSFLMDGCNELLEQEGPNRLADYKTRSIICDQETRRLKLLSDQKRRREKIFNDFRSTELFSNWDNDDLDEKEEEVMEWSEMKKPKQPRLKDMFMLSEWMVTLPEEFDTKWMFVICPVGKRCLVSSSKGYTSAYGKRGQRLAKFQSALPNGSQRDGSRYRYSKSEVTILDCIWSSQNKCYFILDLLSWKGQLYMDTEMNFRTFWIKSKLEEMPFLSERSERNIYPFIHLDYHPCDLFSISSTISKHACFNSNELKIDGLLFYHSEAFYIPGSTPLVLWLKPFMLPEILNMVIPDIYHQMKPLSYIDMKHYIMEYEERKMKKNIRRIKGGKTNQIDEKTERIPGEINFSDEV